MNDELDHIMGALRSPATGDELADESVVVDRMYHAHESKGPTMFTSRRTRVATLIAAGALGFGSVAAAGPVAMQIMTNDTSAEDTSVEAPAPEEPAPEEPAPEEPAPEEPAPEEPAPEEPAPEEPAPEEPAAGAQVVAVEGDEIVIEEPAPMPELVDDPATDFFDESQCLPGNHGKTVSAVARGDFEYYERDAEGEKIGDPIEVPVRDAARSSCGKDFEVDLDEDVDPEENVELDEEFEVEEMDEPEPKGRPDHAGGKDKAKDNGKDKAKGKPDHAGKGKGGRG